ncbi:MAG: ATP-binding protein [Thermodesulfobacteriota bacterium]
MNAFLSEWKTRKNRKPLVIRGARQVGKTSSVHRFGRTSFETYIYINLELEDHAGLFSKMQPVTDLLQIIQLKFNTKVSPGTTLLFIDEVQNSAIAMNQLRYFHEEIPELHVVAAGSLLEVKLKSEGFAFPVGRVEYYYLHPVTFDEFLSAQGEAEALSYLSSVKADTLIPGEIHDMMLKKFHTYLLVGGMPEAVARYAETKSFIDVDPIYESILTGLRDDVSKYASAAKTKYIQHIIEHASKYVGQQIKYERFGGSNFRSREMSAAFDVCGKAMLISRVFASKSKQMPLVANLKKSPKLVHLDAGLVNYQIGMRSEIARMDDINVIYHGQIAEQIVGQTLLAMNTGRHANLHYWYREQKSATSEVDYLIPMNNRLIPIEVKSGKTGTLRSLLNFMDESGSELAVRVYSGNMQTEKITTPGKKKFMLFSMPFYLLFRIRGLLE